MHEQQPQHEFPEMSNYGFDFSNLPKDPATALEVIARSIAVTANLLAQFAPDPLDSPTEHIAWAVCTAGIEAQARVVREIGSQIHGDNGPSTAMPESYDLTNNIE